MADTTPDHSISNLEWTDLYLISSIAVSSKLVIANKTASIVLIQLTATKPNDDDKDGPFIMPFSYQIVEAGENGAFVRGINQNSTINIQEG